MAVTDWVSNLYQSEQTRGLSGAAASAVALDDSNPYYNYKLRRHRTSGDLLQDPGLLWYTSSLVESRDGLGVHLAAEYGDGTATFTDVLLILSAEDYRRLAEHKGEPWLGRATRTLLAQFDTFCAREGFKLKFPHRQLGLKVIADGSRDMGARSLGLQRGEFVTGLLPNLYTGPVKGSKPVLGVHLALPGIWEGYQEVARLYSDQMLFTLGASWLDNFNHPSLREAALYRLRQDGDGHFIHILNPDLQDRYQLTTTRHDDTSVLTIATREGEPLAYLVLEAIAAKAPVEEGPDIAPPMLIDGRVLKVEPHRGKTIIPEAPSERLFTLQERAVLLQKVHFRNFMLGYDVFLGTRGELGTLVDEKAATFQVRRKDLAFVAHIDGILLDGAACPVGEALPIERDCVLDALGQRLEVKITSEVAVEKWPYIAEIRRPASSNYMMWGQVYKVGRATDSRVVLPDNPDNRNIVWRPEVAEGTTIKARTGDIEKSKFYTDSIMVASQHAEIDLNADEPAIVCTAKNCFVYVRRYGNAIFPLYPTSSGLQPTEMGLEPGDELLIGNSIFYVGFTPSSGTVTPAAPPKPMLSADSLVEAVSAPDFGESAGSLPPGPKAQPTPAIPAPPPAPSGSASRRDQVLFDDLAEARTVSSEVAPPAPRAVGARAAAVEWEEEDSWEDRRPVTPPDPGLASLSAPPPPPRQEAPPVPAPLAAPASLPAPAAAKPAPPAPPVDEAPAPPPPAPPAAPSRVVAAVSEADAKFELGREMHLVLCGWMVAGEATLGNHSGADLVLPENRIDATQAFTPVDYFSLKVRGRKSSLHVLASREFLFNERDVDGQTYDDLDEKPIDIIRRDEEGQEDFAVRLELFEDPSLPNPRARFLSIDTRDKLTKALVTRGFPANQPRTLVLRGMSLTFTYGGGEVRLTDYLGSYKRPDGTFADLFVQHGDEDFATAPEDGSPIVLKPQDRLIVGNDVYLVRKR